jgi:hypothetical protein
MATPDIPVPVDRYPDHLPQPTPPSGVTGSNSHPLEARRHRDGRKPMLSGVTAELRAQTTEERPR